MLGQRQPVSPDVVVPAFDGILVFFLPSTRLFRSDRLRKARLGGASDVDLQGLRFLDQSEVNGRKLVMATHLIATVPASELGESRLNLTKYHDDIVAALDMLFQGF